MIKSPSNNSTSSSSSSSSSSPVIIPISSALHVLGRNYDESILLTSKYNQSLLRDRRVRQNHLIDNQTGIQQKNSALYMKTSDRLKVHRTDQIYLYPRRIYRRHNRHNPYFLITSSLEQQQQKTNVKIENQTLDESTNNPSEHINGEISSEILGNVIDEQVVIPIEHLQGSRTNIKQRITSSNNSCSNCQQKFKTKSQFYSHLSKCQSDVELSEPITRRHHSKNESLLISLLKQEAMTEKRSEIPLVNKPTTTSTTNTKFHDDDDDDDTGYDSSHVQLKLEKKDPDFVMRKQKGSKKTSTKTQLISTIQSPSKPLSTVLCTFCGEGNLLNDELIRCSTCQKSTHAYRCLNFQNQNIIKTIKTYSWQCIDCKKCIQCGTVEHDDELLFCDYCDRAYHMDCLNPPLNEPPPGAWYCQLCL